MSKKSVQLMLFMLVILAFTFSGGVQAGEIVYKQAPPEMPERAPGPTEPSGAP